MNTRATYKQNLVTTCDDVDDDDDYDDEDDDDDDDDDDDGCGDDDDIDEELTIAPLNLETALPLTYPITVGTLDIYAQIIKYEARGECDTKSKHTLKSNL